MLNKQQFFDNLNWLSEASLDQIVEKFQIPRNRAAVTKSKARKFLGTTRVPKFMTKDIPKYAEYLADPSTTLTMIENRFDVKRGQASTIRTTARRYLNVPFERKVKSIRTPIEEEKYQKRKEYELLRKKNKVKTTGIEVIDLRKIRSTV